MRWYHCVAYMNKLKKVAKFTDTGSATQRHKIRGGRVEQEEMTENLMCGKTNI